MADLAALVVRMQADNSQYIKALDQATNKLKKFHDDQESLLSQMGEELKGLADEFAAAFAVDKIVEFSAAAIEAQASLAKFSQISGISVESLSGMSLAAAQAGMSQDDLSVSLKKLNVAISEAAGDSTSKAAIAFRLLGVSVKDAEGNVRDAGAVTADVADAFQHSADGANKVALAVALFGRAGQQMIPMLNQGSAGLREMQQAAIDSGAAISGPAAEAAEEFEKKLAVLKTEISAGLGNAIAAELIPTLTMLVDSLGSASERGASFRVIAQGIAEVFKIVATIGNEVAREFESVGTAIGGAAAAVDAAVHGKFAEAKAILDANAGDQAAIQAKYAKVEMELYGQTADSQIAEANRGAKGAEDANKKPQLGSLEGGVKSAEADKELQKYSAGLKEQAAAFGLGAEAAAKYKLQFGPLADSLKIAGAAGHAAAASAIAYARALQFKMDTKTATDLANSLTEQVAKLDQSDAAAFKYKITTGELGLAFGRMGAAGTAAQAQLTKLNNTLIDDRDKKAIQSLNDEIDKTAGKFEKAGVAAFDLQNKTLIQNVGDRGTAADQATIAARRAQIEAMDDYEAEVVKATAIEKDLAATEALINAARVSGNITELQAMKQLNDARLAEITGLQGIYAAEKKIADDSGIPELTEKTKEFATQIVNLKTQTNQLETQVRDNLESSFANNFADLMNGSESFRKAFLNMGKDIEKEMDQIVSKDFAQSLFGTGGAAGGVPSFLSNILGGAAGAGSGGGFSGIASLFGAGGSGVASTGAAATGTSMDSLISSLPAMASGGNMPTGSFALVGENGPELAYAGTQDMHIQPMSSAGKTVQQTNHFTVQSQNGTISRPSQTQMAAEAARQLGIASRRNNT